MQSMAWTSPSAGEGRVFGVALPPCWTTSHGSLETNWMKGSVLAKNHASGRSEVDQKKQTLARLQL
jgi:hypothetical protein